MHLFKFIHAADLHLDSRFKGLTDIPSYVKEELLQSSFFAFSKLIDRAIVEKVDFIVISGDLFDQEERSLQAQLFLSEQFARLKAHDIAAYIIHGNHDPLSNRQTLFNYGDHVHIFPNDKVAALPAYAKDELVAYIYGISYGSKAVYENLTKHYFKRPEDVFHLGLYHGTVGTSTDHEPYAPCSLQDLIALQYDYIALGHIHKKQVLSEAPPIVYAGNIQGRHRKEDGERGCFLVEVNRQKQCSMQFIPLASVEWHSIAIDCSLIEDEQELIRNIAQRIHVACNKAKQSYMVTVILNGVTTLHQSLITPFQQQDLLDALRQLYPQSEAWIFLNKLIIDTSMSYDAASLIADEPFLQKLSENIDELYTLSPKQIIQLGYMRDLWQHYELSKLLPQYEQFMVDGTLDEVKKTILDFVAQDKGRE